MVDFGEQVLRGDWEGCGPVGAENEKHRVWEGIQEEVHSVFGGRPRLKPGRGRRLPAFLPERVLWSGAWQCCDGVCKESGSLVAAGLISWGEHITLRHASRHL